MLCVENENIMLLMNFFVAIVFCDTSLLASGAMEIFSTDEELGSTHSIVVHVSAVEKGE